MTVRSRLGNAAPEWRLGSDMADVAMPFQPHGIGEEWGAIHALGTNGNPLVGTADGDMMLALDAATIRGLGGNDLIVADIASGLLLGISGNNSFATAYSLPASGFVTRENALVYDRTVPYQTIYVPAEVGTEEYFWVQLTAGQTITVDIDAGGGSLGHTTGTNTVVRLYRAADTANPVATNDDSAITAGGYGSVSTFDSFLTYTATVDGPYFIRISEFAPGAGSTLFEGDEQFLVQVSVTGYPINTGTGTNYGNDLEGGDGDDQIFGGPSSDIMDGGPGADLLHGGSGGDGYAIDNPLDIVVEEPGAPGADVVNTIVSYVLPSGAEVERLQIPTIAMYDSLALNLTGNEFGQQLTGNSAANVLDGAGGADLMTGRAGNDTYFVDNIGDSVAELADEGFDVVAAALSWTLSAGAHVELMTTGWIEGTALIHLQGNELSQQIWGNAAANIISGHDGDDTIFGFGGSDTLIGGNGKDVFFGGAGANDSLFGGLGDDTYFVDDGGDGVNEAGGEGSDVVAAGVDYVLGAAISVELMTTGWIGGTMTVALTGNDLGNEIWGNDGVNNIQGGSGNVTDALLGFGGNDRLDGGAGLDLLVGGGGQDSFVFANTLVSAEADIIADFNSADDTILLDDAVFAGLSLGALNPAAFVTGTAALDTNDRIIYDAVTGKLYFDADGSGAGAAVQFGVLSGNPAIVAADFTVI
ncbi:MAG TPA: calcium-binding protein [Allosphingosinicella sp.]|nr:calcium-binding protein [Allosphingosinicella sp.]